ncbi:TonB-dependent receptor [Litorimonas taeanensis]|uniref:TonB-dependent receptor n=1 Tax=Litorimonas taeanensis TaxID=568099 RepID=A0A420WLJ0_9PROT|nr:TonB-dependent receptor [Litorimonas taeanensis]RKQ71893.1 TonB-dependent receptor [Litorimonas taeanensis]
MPITDAKLATLKYFTASGLRGTLLLGTGICTMAYAGAASAQTAPQDEVVATGIRQSLENALVEQRQADSLVEVILAEDIGKLPDQNLAEVLENITGVQITREAGVGTGVQIRGTDENRIEINGVGTVGAGNERGGISFEDIDASIIAGLEVIKAPEAKTTEGSVGGTVNLRTIRPLDLKETLASVRIQGEHSSLSKTTTPRVSGALGKKWENASGQEIGVVLSGSFTQSDVSAFRPRLDRDNPTTCSNGSTTCPDGATHFLGVQFLNQVQINQEYETLNLAGSIEARPSENMKLYADVIYNDQERRQESSRVQVSNISRLNGRSDGADGIWSTFDTFDTFDLGVVEGANGPQDLGSILAVTSGTFSPQQLTDATVDRGAPFLRGSMDSGSRLTESSVVRFGGEYEKDALTVGVEYSTVSSETVNPNLSLTLNFINPNSDRFGTRDENGTPIRFDLRDGIAFGINFDDPFAPTVEDLLNPANYVMDNGGTYSANVRENSEDTFRIDASYDFDTKFLKSVDFGFRHNNRTSLRDNRSASAGGTSNFDNSLNGAAIADLLTAIPDNFGDGTGSDLFLRDILHFNPELAVDAESFVSTINAAIASEGITQSPISTVLVSDELAFFDVEEKTNAFYAQANFEHGVFRGNVGLRYIETDFSSISNERVFDDVGNPSTNQVDGQSSYNFLLPRVNVAMDVRDDIVLRGAYSKDINRPDFTFLTAARTLPNRGGVNDVSRVGNPELKPEEIESFDVSASWYFAPGSVLSAGYFHKTRSSLFGDLIEQPGSLANGDREQVDIFGRDGGDVNGANDGAPCALGGVFSEDTDAGIFGSGRGVCVGDSTRFNADGETTQSGFEFAFQYSLGELEDRLGSFGWASGFGVIANYTHQKEDTNTGFINIGETRAQNIFALQGFDPVTNPVSREAATLLNLSEDSYNLTGFYEKYGLSARVRYTWRSAYRTDDLPGTSNVFDPLGFRGVAGARGQLNASASYDFTDQFTVSVDAVNLTKSDAPVYCVNEDSLLCYQGITDRRVIFGASYTF